MTIGVLIVNFIAHGWMLTFLILGLNFIPAGKVQKVELEVYKMEVSTSWRSGSTTKYFFRWEDGTKEHFSIQAKSYTIPDTIKFRTYKGLLGLPVIQRRLG